MILTGCCWDCGCALVVVMGVTLAACRGFVCQVNTHGLLAKHCSEAAVFLDSCGALVTHLSYLKEAPPHVQILCGIMLIGAVKSCHSTASVAISIASYVQP